MAEAMDCAETLKIFLTYEDIYRKIEELKIKGKFTFSQKLDEIAEIILLQSSLKIESPPFKTEAQKVEFAQAKETMRLRISKFLSLLKNKWNYHMRPSYRDQVFFNMVSISTNIITFIVSFDLSVNISFQIRFFNHADKFKKCH